jgi:hypothetical protein
VLTDSHGRSQRKVSFVGITVANFCRGSSAIECIRTVPTQNCGPHRTVPHTELCPTQNCALHRTDFYFICRRMCDLLDDPCALVSGPRKSQQGESLGMQLGELAHLIVITNISKMQSNTTFNIYIAKRCFYIACLLNYMFRPLYRPSSGCTLSYYKANYTIYSVFVFVHEISFAS